MALTPCRSEPSTTSSRCRCTRHCTMKSCAAPSSPCGSSSTTMAFTRVPEVFERIASYYDGLVDEHGHDPRACDYGNPGAQQTKFRVLSEATPLQGLRVLDVGCGFADWADWLRERVGDVN